MIGWTGSPYHFLCKAQSRRTLHHLSTQFRSINRAAKLFFHCLNVPGMILMMVSNTGLFVLVAGASFLEKCGAEKNGIMRARFTRSSWYKFYDGGGQTELGLRVPKTSPNVGSARRPSPLRLACFVVFQFQSLVIWTMMASCGRL